MEVGLKIKMYLERNGMSQVFLSRETQINRVKLNLCGALGVNTDFFLKPRVPVEKTAS